MVSSHLRDKHLGDAFDSAPIQQVQELREEDPVMLLAEDLCHKKHDLYLLDKGLGVCCLPGSQVLATLNAVWLLCMGSSSYSGSGSD